MRLPGTMDMKADVQVSSPCAPSVR
jgi:hypothetical protein